ncbi:MAG: helix-turn-helix domain-containing protein [Pseudomonadota bacterium]
MTEDKLLRLDDVVQIVKVGKSTWRRWVQNGTAPQKVKHGRSTFWRASDIQNFVKTQ